MAKPAVVNGEMRWSAPTATPPTLEVAVQEPSDALPSVVFEPP
jgi:hypothetical protein